MLRISAGSPILTHNDRIENWSKSPIIRDWEQPVEEPSFYRDPISQIETWLDSQKVGISLTAPGVNLIRLKLAASNLNSRLGYLAWTISTDRVTRRKRQ